MLLNKKTDEWIITRNVINIRFLLLFSKIKIIVIQKIWYSCDFVFYFFLLLVDKVIDFYVWTFSWPLFICLAPIFVFLSIFWTYWSFLNKKKVHLKKRYILLIFLIFCWFFFFVQPTTEKRGPTNSKSIKNYKFCFILSLN